MPGLKPEFKNYYQKLMIENPDKQEDIRRGAAEIHKTAHPVLFPTIDELTAKGAEYREAQQPGYMKTFAQGVGRGFEGLAGGVGAVTRWGGEVIGSETIAEVGKEASDYWKRAAQTGWEKADEDTFSGTFMEKPSLKRAVGIVGEAAPSMAAGMGAGGIAAKAGLGITKAALASGGALGLLEGAGTYEEAREKGKTVKEASALGGLATVTTAGLEALGIGKILGAKGSPIRGAIVGAIAEGGTEAAQTVAQNLIAKFGYDKTRDWNAGLAESIIGGVGLGGPAGAVSTKVDFNNEVVRDMVESGVDPEEIQTMAEEITSDISKYSPPKDPGAPQDMFESVKPSTSPAGQVSALELQPVEPYFGEKTEEELFLRQPIESGLTPAEESATAFEQQARREGQAEQYMENLRQSPQGAIKLGEQLTEEQRVADEWTQQPIESGITPAEESAGVFEAEERKRQRLAGMTQEEQMAEARQKIEEPAKIKTPKGAKVRTLRGAIRENGGIDFGDFKGELRDMSQSVKYLSKKGGTPIDLMEKTLKEEGWMMPEESLIDKLRDDPDFLRRPHLSKESSEKLQREKTAQELQVEEEMAFEPEEPPTGRYTKAYADELKAGDEITAIHNKGAQGWGKYTVTIDDAGDVVLQGDESVELTPFDEVEILQEEQRKDISKRKKIDEMSPEEMRAELLIDYKTGLGNQRAYDESVKKKYYTSVDVDGLKWVNDNVGHDAGDALIANMGEAFKQEGLESYHQSGDEYSAQSDSQEQLDLAMERADKYLKDNPIEIVLPDGTQKYFTGSFSYGTAETIKEAEQALAKQKSAREVSGERYVRGAEPTRFLKDRPKGDADQGRREGREDVVEELPLKEKIDIKQKLAKIKEDIIKRPPIDKEKESPFVYDKVMDLGSIEAVDKEFTSDSWKDKYARETARRLFKPDAEVIKFKKPKPQYSTEDAKDLTALHNTDERSLMEALKSGGLAVPSMAITKKGIAFEGFGDVTLVGNKEMIDPIDKSSKVYERDIYSTRTPSKEYDRLEKESFKLYKSLEQAHADTDTYLSDWDYKNRDRIIDDSKRSPGWRLTFLREKGIPLRIPKKLETVGEPLFNTESFKEFAEENKDLRTIDFDSPDKKRLGDAIKQSIEEDIKKFEKEDGKRTADYFKESYMKNWFNEEGVINFNRVDSALKAIQKLTNPKQLIDKKALDTRIENKFTRKLQAEYDQWAKEKIDSIFSDPYVKRGRKKLPYTLDNIVDEMLSKKLTASEKTMTYGPGKAGAAAAKRILSIKAMHKKKGMIVSKEDLQEYIDNIQDPSRDAFFGDILEYNKYPDGFQSRDDAMKAIAGYLQGKPTERNMEYELSRNDFVNVPDWAIQSAMDFANVLKDTPTQYFEGKLQRAVEPSEFTGAVIPKDSSKEFKQALRDAGLKFKTYDKNIEGSRQQAVNSFQKKKDVLFSKDKLSKPSKPVDKKSLEALPYVERVTGKEGNYRLHFKNNISIPLKTVKLTDEGAYVFTPSGKKLIRGKFTPGQSIEITQAGDIRTVAHENLHFFESIGLLSGKDIRLLNRAGEKMFPGEDDKTELRAKYFEAVSKTAKPDSVVGKIYAKIKDFVTQMRQIFGRTAGGVISDIETGKIFDEKKPDVKEPVTQYSTEDEYTRNFKESKNIKGNVARNVRMVKKEVQQGLDKYLGAISTRLGNINPKLKSKIRKLSFDTDLKSTKDVQAVEPMLRKVKNSMTPEDMSAWDLARKNSDTIKIDELTKKYGIESEYKAYRKTLDKIRDEAIDVGLEVGYIEDYAPRLLKDSKGFLEAIGKEGDWPVISRRLKERAEAMGLSVDEMNADQKADIISNMLHGGSYGLGSVAATKKRKVKKISPELNKYYMDSDAALVSHIHSMRKAIEARKFFGKTPEYVSEAKRRLNAAQKEIANFDETTEKRNKEILLKIDNLESKNTLTDQEQATLKRLNDALKYFQKNRSERLQDVKDNLYEYEQKVNRYANQRDFRENIGAYVNDLIEKGEISAADEQQLIDILTARFNEKGTSGLVQAYKNLSYIDTMGSVTSALTQIGDLAWAGYEAGIIPTLKNAYKAAKGESRITKEDVGVERIAQEFADPGSLGKAVSTVFKLVGLEKMDTIGKEALLNSSLDKYKKQASKDPEKLKSEIKNIFEGETDSVIKDLQNDEITDNVKLLVYNRLLDFQPAALSEMPQKYLDAGNGRLFYMLKSFTLKQFDVFRNEVYKDLKSKDPKKKIQGMKNFVKLASFFVLANAGADELKDFVLGRKTDLDDRVVDNILKLGGISKFVTWKARTEGVGSAMAKQILPPFKFLDAATKDIVKAGDGKGLETLASIPVFGKLAYWHMGRGVSKRGDLWDRRLRKKESKLKDLKQKYDESKDKRDFKIKYKEELSDYRKTKNFRTRINRIKRRINKLKSLPETQQRLDAISKLEEKRTNMIKEFLG